MPSDRTYRDLESGQWAALLPTECPCHGSGWMLSTFDTWHRCPIHGNGVPHPEDEHVDFDRDAHCLETWRTCWRYLQGWRRSLGFQGPMTAWVVRLSGKCPATPQEWVEVAYGLVTQGSRVQDEADARAQGYSCNLERALAEEARTERDERYYYN